MLDYFSDSVSCDSAEMIALQMKFNYLRLIELLVVESPTIKSHAAFLVFNQPVFVCCDSHCACLKGVTCSMSGFNTPENVFLFVCGSDRVHNSHK